MCTTLILCYFHVNHIFCTELTQLSPDDDVAKLIITPLALLDMRRQKRLLQQLLFSVCR